MTFTIAPRTDVATQEWDKLVRASPDGWVFSLWDWQELILGVSKWALRDRSFGIRERGALIAVVPLQYSPHTGKLMSSGWGGSGPVLSDTLSEKKRRQVLKTALDHAMALGGACDARAIEFSCSPVTRTSIGAAWGVNPFELIGMRDRSSLSQIIDLSPTEDDLWRCLSERARKDVERAKSAGYTVARVPWRDHVDAYYSIHETTYRRTGVDPHPKSYFQGMADRLSDSGSSVLWMARDPDGRPAAFHNSARLGIGAYYHTGCSTERASIDGANFALFWESMIDAKRNGATWYDAGAINPASVDKKQIGLTFFKTRFGGAPHRAFFGEFEIQRPETAAPSTPASSFARRTLGKLIHVARKLS